MKLFGFSITKEKSTTSVTIPTEKKQTDGTNFQSFAYQPSELPSIIKDKKVNYVLYGENNCYLHRLKYLSKRSGMHSRILATKAQMMAGDGLLVNGAKTEDESKLIVNSLPLPVKEAYDNFLENEYGNEILFDVMSKCSNDYQIYGAYAMEVIWNLTFDRIAAVKYIEVVNIAPGLYENGNICMYHYCRDWKDAKRNPPIELQAFRKDSKELVLAGEDICHNQIIYVKNGTNEYFGEPSYEAGLEWIETDSEVGTLHKNNVKKNFSPQMHFKFYQRGSSPEAEAAIKQAIKKEFQGSTGEKFIVTFDDGRENATEIVPLNVTAVDKLYNTIADQTTQQILSIHGVTSPLMFGITVPGSLGGNTEIEKAFILFDNLVVAPDRNKLERTLNMLLSVNNIPVKVEIKQFNPTISKNQTA